MAKVDKQDFFCGAFLSYLITNKVEPTLFDTVDKSRVYNFTLDKKDFNVYIKYVCTERKTCVGGKDYSKWCFTFSDKEKNYLIYKFKKADKDNIIVLVCTNPELDSTCLAYLTYEQAVKCLGTDRINKQPNIVVKCQKGSKHLNCYGTAIADKDAIKIKRDIDTYFGF